MNTKVKSLIYCSLGACMIAIGAQLTIVLPMTVVPITMQTLAVYIIAYLYERKQAVLACLIYLLLGAVGLPVFAGFSGGIFSLAAPTGGYLIALPVMAFVISTLLKRKILALIVGTIVCYTLGTLWFMWYMKMALLPALTLCVFPFLIGDTLKIVLTCLITKRIRKF